MRFIPYGYVYPFYTQWQTSNNHLLQINASLHPQNQFPPVDTKQLHSSAERFQVVMREARLLIDKIVSTPSFAHELMNAAQQSNQQRVDDLIASTGVSIRVKTTYSPTGIQIQLDSSEPGEGCCKLEMNLLW